MAARRKRDSPKKRVPRTWQECRTGSDLLLPHIGEQLRAELAEEQRRAEEAEDRHFDELGTEIEAHPIGHPGHVPHGCT